MSETDRTKLNKIEKRKFIFRYVILYELPALVISLLIYIMSKLQLRYITELIPFKLSIQLSIIITLGIGGIIIANVEWKRRLREKRDDPD
ncbi:MAG: hypothetical protein GY839_12315 [candidate division Zixibacteria bacterium]|nr:hypothetical protein [candidate division Zixibacteria bacterium]